MRFVKSRNPTARFCNHETTGRLQNGNLFGEGSVVGPKSYQRDVLSIGRNLGHCSADRRTCKAPVLPD